MELRPERLLVVLRLRAARESAQHDGGRAYGRHDPSHPASPS